MILQCPSRSLARERGLKRNRRRNAKPLQSSLPRTGAWIETIHNRNDLADRDGRSLARERGLKLHFEVGPNPKMSRSLARERGLKPPLVT